MIRNESKNNKQQLGQHTNQTSVLYCSTNNVNNTTNEQYIQHQQQPGIRFSHNGALNKNQNAAWPH
jgi:hypothetical protein